MQAKANPTLIGLFVLIGIALAISALLLLGAPGRTGKTYDLVVYFEGDVNGLNVGAPVNLRGVQIGSVKSIRISFEEQGMTLQIPVIISIDQNRIGLRGDSVEDGGEELVNRLIAKGLRATLSLQSLLTGRLQVDLDFHPGTPARLVGSGNENMLELPTIPSSLDKLAKSLEDLPVEELTGKVMSILNNVEKLLAAPELMLTIRNLGRAGTDAAALIQQLRHDLGPLLKQWQDVGVAIDDLVANVDAEVQPISGSLQETLDASRSTLNELSTVFAQANHTLATMQSSLDENSPLYQDLQVAIQDIAAAARAYRVVAEYLQTHPEALLQGKSGH